MVTGMLAGLIAVIVTSIFVAACFRHFFIQLITAKLLIDCLLLLLSVARAPNANAFHGQAVAMLVAAAGLLMFFVLMASGIQRFARSANENLEVKLD